jgi:hypothetical protein
MKSGKSGKWRVREAGRWECIKLYELLQIVQKPRG